MTVSYNKDVISSRFSIVDNNMLKLLFRWKGSVYKLIWGDCAVFLVFYTLLALVYSYGLDKSGRDYFENLAIYFNKFANNMPLHWILGFYVGIVVKRWWEQFQTIPWPDDLAFKLNAAIKTNNERAKMTRRTIIRYVNLGITIALMRNLDPSNKNNPYKSFDDLLDTEEGEGLLMEDEKKIIDGHTKKIIDEHTKQHQNKPDKKTKKKSFSIFKSGSDDCKPKSFEEFWIPLTWALSLIKKAGKDGLIKDEFAMRAMVADVIGIRKSCTKLMCFEWINVPLVYTQVVTITVYSFAIASILGSQYHPHLKPDDPNFNFYVPVFTLLQFVFYIGWLKVAETLLNPFGGDDEDFEIVYLIKRNKQAGYAIVDDLVVEPPELRRDPNWGDTITEVDIDNVEVRRDVRRRESMYVKPLNQDEENGQVMQPIQENKQNMENDNTKL